MTQPVDSGLEVPFRIRPIPPVPDTADCYSVKMGDHVLTFSLRELRVLYASDHDLSDLDAAWTLYHLTGTNPFPCRCIPTIAYEFGWLLTAEPLWPHLDKTTWWRGW